MRRRILMILVGVVLIAFGMGMLKYANLGVDPYNVLVLGISSFLLHTVGLPFCTYGNVFIALTGLGLVWVFFADKRFIGFGTLAHLAVAGKLTELVEAHILSLFPMDALWKQLHMLGAGFAVFCVALSVYYAASLGVPAYDALALHMSNRQIMQYRWCRITTDVSCVVLGCVLGAVATGLQGIIGAQIGSGTLLTAFATGPCIQFLRTRFFDPFVGVAQAAG